MNEDAVTAARHLLNQRLAAAPYLAVTVLMIGALLFLAAPNAVDVAPSRWEPRHAAGTAYAQKHDPAVRAVLDRYEVREDGVRISDHDGGE